MTSTLCLFTSNEILQIGLSLVGYNERQQARVKRKTNKTRFKQSFGSSANVYAAIWQNLQQIGHDDYRLVVKEESALKSLKLFLITIHFLKKYSTEVDDSGRFGLSDRTIRDNKWKLLERIQYLKKKNIRWPKAWNSKDATIGEIPVFLVSVDGIHCSIQEPRHGCWSKNPDYYSHKFKRTGLAYEVARLCLKIEWSL